MIDRKKLRDMMVLDKSWGHIEPPEDFTVSVRDTRIPRRPVWSLFRGSFLPVGAVAALCAVVAITLLLTVRRGEKVMISHPYNGEKTVEVIGSINRWSGRIRMQLDRDRKFWIAEIRVPGRGIYEYQLIIDDLIYTAGDSPYRIREVNGNEKAVLIVTGGAGVTGTGS